MPQVPCWIPPPRGVLKVNVDAALSKNSDIAAMAAVARDETGMFLGASALVVEGITSPEVAEAMACREGLALASDLDLQKIRIHGLCQCGEEHTWARYGTLWPYRYGDQGRGGSVCER